MRRCPQTVQEMYRDGKDSGFPLCCIVYFIFRNRFWGITGKLINIHLTPKKVKHIVCPIHSIYHMFFPLKQYFTCSNCNWIQYGQEECVRCKDCKHQFPKNEPECTVCGYHRYPVRYTVVKEGSEFKYIKIYDRE